MDSERVGLLHNSGVATMTTTSKLVSPDSSPPWTTMMTTTTTASAVVIITAIHLPATYLVYESNSLLVFHIPISALLQENDKVMKTEKITPCPLRSNGKRRSTDCSLDVGENGTASKTPSAQGDDGDISSEILRVEAESEKPLTAFAHITKGFQVGYSLDNAR